MKLTKLTTLSLCTLLAITACDSNTPATDTKVAAATTTEPSEPAVAAPATTETPAPAMTFEAYATPGPEHKTLALSSGRWDAEVTSWWVPGQPPSKSTLVTENKMILGGRYQQSTSKGKMDGKPFEGVSTTAFDNAKKKYLSTWVDNMGTGIMSMEGVYDEPTKTINFSGTMIDPTSGKDQPVRETFTLIDNDHQLMQMYCNGPDGKEYKTMQIMFTRKK